MGHNQSGNSTPQQNRSNTLSYDLYIWDPARHAPLPSTDEEAYDTKERLSELEDGRNFSLTEFGNALVQRFAANPAISAGALEDFWGADPRVTVSENKFAAICLRLPAKGCTQQIAYAVDAAAALGLVVFDDNYGSCFLPDGNIMPEDMKAIWASDLAEMQADAADPTRKKPDGRNIWQRIAGELVDAIGRGNPSR